VCAIRVQGQSKVDSLIKELNREARIPERIDLQYEIAYELIGVDNTQALEVSSEAFSSSLQASDSLRAVRTGRLKASALRRLERIQESIQTSEFILRVARRNAYLEEVKMILNPLAVAYTLNAEYDNALQIHLEALEIRKADGNKNDISGTLNNIGLVYFKMKNYGQAIQYYSEALTMKFANRDMTDVDRILINLGLCHNQLKQFDQAVDYINKGFDQCGNNCSDRIITEGQFGLGVSYYGRGELETASRHFNKSLAIARVNEDKRFQGENLVYLGRIGMKSGKYDSAIAQLTRTEELAAKSDYNQLLLDVYKEFSKLYNLTGDFDKQLYYKNHYISLKEKLTGEDFVKNIVKIQSGRAGKLKNAVNGSSTGSSATPERLNLLIAVFSLIPGILALFLYRRYILTKKLNRALTGII